MDSLTSQITQPLAFGYSIPPGELEKDSKAIVPDQLVKELHVALCRKYARDNLFYSPLSIDVGLGLLLLGCKGKAARELVSAGVSTDHSGRRDILQQVKGVKGATLTLASRLFCERNSPLRALFIEKSQSLYGAPVYPLDFKRDPEQSCKNVNKWASYVTKGKISELLDNVPRNTSLVLANAVYFKALWKDKFDARLTHERDFHVAKGKSVPTNFMEKEDEFDMAIVPTLRSFVIKIPYMGDELAMYIIRPNAGLGTLEECLDQNEGSFDEILCDVENKFCKEKLLLRIPRFRFELTLDLVAALKAIGVGEIFCESADFTDISKSAKLMVSSAIHKAFVDVSEEGTEAAAATGIVIIERSLPLPPTEVTLDEPFMFFIRHIPSRSTIFVGRYLTPTAEPEPVVQTVKQNLEVAAEVPDCGRRGIPMDGVDTEVRSRGGLNISDIPGVEVQARGLDMSGIPGIGNDIEVRGRGLDMSGIPGIGNDIEVRDRGLDMSGIGNDIEVRDRGLDMSGIPGIGNDFEVRDRGLDMSGIPGMGDDTEVQDRGLDMSGIPGMGEVKERSLFLDDTQVQDRGLDISEDLNNISGA